MQNGNLSKQICERGGLIGTKRGKGAPEVLVGYKDKFQILCGVLFVQKGNKTIPINLAEYSNLKAASRVELEEFGFQSAEIQKLWGLILLVDLVIISGWAVYSNALGWTPKGIAWCALGIVLSTFLGMYKVFCIRVREKIASPESPSGH